MDLGEQFTDGVDRCDTDEQWRDVHHHAARVPQHRRSPSGYRNMNLDSLFRRHPREVQRERSDDRCSVVLGFVEKGTTSVRHQCAFESALGLRGPRSLRQAGSGEGGIALSPVLPVGGESIRHSVPLVDVVQRAQRRGTTRLRVLSRRRGRVPMRNAVHHGHGTETVERNMMDAAVPQIVRVTHAQHSGRDDSVDCQVELCPAISAHPPEGILDRIGGPTEVDKTDGDLRCLVHVLHRLTVDLDHFEQRRLKLVCHRSRFAIQQFDVEFAAQLHVVRYQNRDFGIELLSEPGCPLGGRERKERLIRRVGPTYLEGFHSAPPRMISAAAECVAASESTARKQEADRASQAVVPRIGKRMHRPTSRCHVRIAHVSRARYVLKV